MTPDPPESRDSDGWIRLLFRGSWMLGGILFLLAFFYYGTLTAAHLLLGLLLGTLHQLRLRSLIDALLLRPASKPGKRVVTAFLFNLSLVALCLMAAFYFSPRNGLALLTGYASFILAALLIGTLPLFRSK